MNTVIKKYYSDIAESVGSSNYHNTIDAHVHFWKFDKKRDTWITREMSVLRQDYLPEHLSLSLQRNGVNGVIAVQADQSELETHFLVELAATHPLIKGVVGWVDLRKENIEDRLHYFSQYPVIKGFRHIVQSEPSGFLADEAFLKGIGLLHQFNLTYDMLIFPHQLKEAIACVAKFPHQKFIIDHCAKPKVSAHEITEWAACIKELAGMPNVYCKISGLFTEAAWKQWSAADFFPFLDVIFNSFGTDRLLFGSDWPVMLLSGIYVQWKSLLEKYMEAFSTEDKEKIFGANAIQFYNL